MHLAFALPEPARTGGGGGTDYVSGLVPALRELGHAVDVQTGPDPVWPSNATPIVDGMLLPMLQDRLGELRSTGAAALVHHISAAAGRDNADRARVRAIEAQMLPELRRIVATSEPVGARLASEFAVTPRVVPPGARDLPRTTPASGDPLILSVGVLTRRKGHDLLLRAAARLTDLPWCLIIAGDAVREPAHAAELATLIGELGLSRRAELRPNPDRETLDAAWKSAAIFALATRWEGYPTAIAEALRRGIPSVVSDGGSVTDLIPVMAGAVVQPDDMATFGKCLRRVLFDAELRRDMSDAAWHTGRELPGWPERARAFITALED